MPDIRIRLLTASDAEQLWKLRLEALEREAGAFGSSAVEHQASTPAEFSTHLTADPKNNFIVGAFRGEQLAGMAGFARYERLKERQKGGYGASTYLPRRADKRLEGRCCLESSNARPRSPAWS